MKPLVEGLQKDYKGKVEFKLYDVEKSPEGQALAEKFNAQYVPTFVFVNSDGTVAGTAVGEMKRAALASRLDALK